ncbi:hypothetical protein [Cupriavidus nantongensis]
MPAKPLSPEQKADAERLKKAWESFRSMHTSATQEWLADQCGWKTQAAVNQYLLGKIPLNLPALLKFSAALGVSPADISPALAKPLGESTQGVASVPSATPGVARLMKALDGLSDEEIMSVAKALEALRRPASAPAEVVKFKVGTPAQAVKMKR